jgi:hypothetical protein
MARRVPARMRGMRGEKDATPGPSPKAKRLAKPVPSQGREYEIIDERIVPDMLGQVGTSRIIHREGKRYVRMSEKQARWYLDHLAIRPLQQ